MRTNLIECEGRILFEPENKTKKHEAQSEKKRVAMVVFGCDMTDYYAWFVKRHFDINLQKPLRGAHVTFVNDWFYAIDEPVPNEEREAKWRAAKKKYNGKKIKITLSLDLHGNGKHWWLIVKHEYRDELLAIREEMGLGKPGFGFHMTLGHVVYHEKTEEMKKEPDNTDFVQSMYIHDLEKKGFIDLKERWKG